MTEKSTSKILVYSLFTGQDDMKVSKASLFYTVLLYFFFSQSAFAASYVYSVIEDQRAKEVKVVVNVDPEGVALNAYEGQMSFDKEALNLNRIETDNSIVGAWPTFPEAGNSPVGDDAIYFEGVSQAGFSGIIQPGSTVRASGKLLTLVFSVKKEGATEISLTGAHVYASDGNATDIPVRDIVIPLSLKKYFLKSSYFIPTLTEKEIKVTGDSDIYAIVTTNDDLYNGQKFVAFEKRNQQKSLASFQVAESASKNPDDIPDFSWITAKSPYLLTKTDAAPYVHIKAKYTDGSYAYKTVRVSVENNDNSLLISYILGVFFFLILVIYYASPRKQKNL